MHRELVPLLKSNRTHHEKEERENRFTERQRHVHNVFSKIRTSLPPLVTVEVVWPSDEQDEHPKNPRLSRVDMPFPTTAELLTWPAIREMVEVDRSVEEMEKAFNEDWQEISKVITGWRKKVPKDVVDIWRKELEESYSRKGKQSAPKGSAQRAQDLLLARAKTKRKSRKGKERASTSYDFTCGTSLPQCTVTFTKPDGTTTEDVNELPDDLRLLLRADTLFESRISSPFYPDFLLDHYSAFIPIASDTTPGSVRVWRPHEVTRDDARSATAKILLKLIGASDATYAEMKGAGQAFICQRCSCGFPYDWQGIVSSCKLQSSG